MIRATMAFLGCILVCCIPPRMPFYPPQKRAGDLTSYAIVAGAGSNLAVLRFSCLPDSGENNRWLAALEHLRQHLLPLHKASFPVIPSSPRPAGTATQQGDVPPPDRLRAGVRALHLRGRASREQPGGGRGSPTERAAASVRPHPGANAPFLHSEERADVHHW